MIRPSAVAGAFYPADARSLEHALDLCFAHTAKQTSAPAPIALICPHAGYVYSGPAAATAYAAVPEDSLVDTVVIIGPNHSGLGPPVSTSAAASWDTVLGPVAVDDRMAARVQGLFPQASLDDLAHSREHSIEVQIPFLQFRLKRPFRVLPIALSLSPTPRGHDVCADLGRALAEAALPGRALFVASTDMSHYLSAAEARKRDQPAIDAVLALDSERLVRAVREHNISMCGVMPAAAVIACAVALGASRAELVDYRTSGDVTGDPQEVVSYAAFVIR